MGHTSRQVAINTVESVATNDATSGNGARICSNKEMLAGISRVKDEYRRISGKNYCLQSVPITHNKINGDRDIFENVIVWTRVVMNSAPVSTKSV